MTPEQFTAELRRAAFDGGGEVVHLAHGALHKERHGPSGVRGCAFPCRLVGDRVFLTSGRGKLS